MGQPARGRQMPKPSRSYVTVRRIRHGFTDRHMEGLAGLIDLFHKAPAVKTPIVIVGALVRPFWKLDLRPANCLVRDSLQDMRDAVKARASFVIGADHVPR